MVLNKGPSSVSRLFFLGFYFSQVVDLSEGKLNMAGLPTSSPVSGSDNTWTSSGSPSACWNGITCSSSGEIVAAAACLGGSIYLSTDFGVSWTQSDSPGENWFSITSSSSGELMAAVVNGGGLYLSTNYGVSWSQTSAPSSSYWSCIASSSTGQYVMATANIDGFIYVSSDYGSSWNTTSSVRAYYNSIAVSSDGQYVAVAVSNGPIYLSTNYGASFSESSASSLDYYWISSDSTGQYLVAVVDNGGIYYSLNYGSSWSESNAPSSESWHTVSSDSTGQYVAAGIGCFGSCDGSIYLSEDYGATWYLSNAPTDKSYDTLISNDNGQLIFAADYDSIVYIGDVNATSDDFPNLSPSFLPTETPTNSGNPTTAPSLLPSAFASFVETVKPTNAIAVVYQWSGELDMVGNLTGVASSSTGQYLFAASPYNGVYVSTDFGISFVLAETPMSTDDQSMACSASGEVVVAASIVGQVYLSKSFGSSWSTASLPVAAWQSVAMSGSGDVIVLCEVDGSVGVSTDSGGSWYLTSLPSSNCAAVAASESGLYLAAVSSNGIYLSSNTGFNWNLTSSYSAVAITVSETGQYLTAALATGGTVYSVDFGATWNESDAMNLVFAAICGSYSGSVVSAAPSTQGQVITSFDGGETWYTNEGSDIYDWAAIASNGNGSQVVAVTRDGQLVIGVDKAIPTAAPTLAAVPTPKPSKFITFVPTSFSDMQWNATDAPSSSWIGISASSNGQFVVAVSTDGSIYYSSEFGYYWSESSVGNLDWLSVAISGGGQYAVAGSKSAGLYYSSSYGQDWDGAVGTTGEEWVSLCSSESGQIAFAASSSGKVMTSAKFGVNWTTVTVLAGNQTASWKAITCDATGLNIALTSSRGVYLSADSGDTWTLSSQSQTFSAVTSSLASNSTGQFVVAAAGSLGIMKSENYGLNWTSAAVPAIALSWSFICMDDSGQHLAVVSTSSDYVYLSSDYGESWSPSSAEYLWSVIAIDGSGLMVYSAVQGGTIYVGKGNSSLVVAAPSPTRSPTGSTDSVSGSSTNHLFTSDKISNFLVCIPGAMVLAARSVLLFVRRPTHQTVLNKLHNIYWETFESCFKAVNVVLSFNVLINLFDSYEHTTFLLLLTSRVVVAGAWFLFLVVLMLPLNNSVKVSQLFLYLNSKVMQEKTPLFGLSMRLICLGGILGGCFDVTLLRLLPWTNSEFTSKIQGYPNLFTVRVCLYGTFVGTLCQSLSSLIELTHQHTAYTVVFMLVSVFKLMLSVLSLVLFLQLANTSTLEVSLAFGDKKQIEEDIEMRPTMSAPPPPPEVLPELEVDISNPIYIESTNAEIATTPADPTPPPRDNRPRDSFDEEAPFGAKVKYADETMAILKEQLAKKGENPLEYIPLPELKAELESIFTAVNNGQPYDEARLDYLLVCMDYNPEYKRQKEEEEREWREKIGELAEESLHTMRSFVPPFIFQASVDSLKSQCNYSTELAKRLFTKKCLWLVRVELQDIERMHIAELQGRFNPQGQGLDIVETAAIYAAIPSSFGKDHKKEAWRLSIEKQLKDMDKERQTNKLSGAKKRHPAYKGQTGLYGERETMHGMNAVSGDAFKSRDSFLLIGKGSAAAESSVGNPIHVGEKVSSESDSGQSTDTAAAVQPKRHSLPVSEELSQKLNQSLLARLKEKDST